MTSDHGRILRQHLRDVADSAEVREASDQNLVASFAANRDERAFSTLVQRHGAMVLGVCKRVLAHDQDAEDACQATFLILARKAKELRDRQLVGSWLYGVAQRTALKARTSSARRAIRESAATVPTPRDPITDLSVREAPAVVDEELHRLPDKFRAPLVLCCLEGLARDEAAKQLGWPVNLVKSRLEQGREMLRSRLVRRGLTLSAGMFALGLIGTAAHATLPERLAASTILFASSGSGAGTVPAPVMSLVKGMLQTMFFEKMKTPVAVCLVAVTLALGAGGVYLAAMPTDDNKPGADVPKDKPTPPPGQPGNQGPSVADLKPESLKEWGRGESIFTAKLTRVDAGPVAFSQPPIYNHTLHLEVIKSIRGTQKKDEVIKAHNSARQEKAPTFPVEKEVVVAISQGRNGVQVMNVVEATADAVKQAELASMVPIGWTLTGKELLSPWAIFKDKAWPADARAKTGIACSQTGRPALLVGPGVEMTVESVPPKKEIQFTNPDGDGEYKVTIKNTTDKPVSIPALLSGGDKVLWDESLVLVCQDKIYPVPTARGIAKAPQPTTLKPGEAISTVVNVLLLNGPEWPRGGYRIEFQFGLGEKSVTKSLYFMTRHHGVLRDKLIQEKKDKE